MLQCRSQWPSGLRRRSAVSCLLRLWVQIPQGAWMSVCCECCVMSGRGLCDELITRPEESYRLWCVVVCDLETSWMRRPWPTGGLSCQKQTNKYYSQGIMEADILSILLNFTGQGVQRWNRWWYGENIQDVSSHKESLLLSSRIEGYCWQVSDSCAFTSSCF